MSAGKRFALIAAAALLTAPAIARDQAPATVFDTEPPTIPADLRQPAILVFSKTRAFHHDSIAESKAALVQLARAKGWGVLATDNSAMFDPAILPRFEVVVWNSATGDVLSPTQKHAFRTWLESGGGFVGLHAAGDSSMLWPWFEEEVIGARFTGHPMAPQFQRARIVVEDHDHPATRELGLSWSRVDEWYSFDHSPRGQVRVLARLDESSYDPNGVEPGSPGLAMGDHPVIWSRCVGSGRAFYSALGHLGIAYREPPHIKMIAGAIAWAMGEDEADC